MFDASGIRARMSLAEDYLRSHRYLDAINTLTPILDSNPHVETVDNQRFDAAFCDSWMKIVYCNLMAGRQKDAYALLMKDRETVNKKSRKHFSMAIAFADSLNGGGATRLRSEAERFSQGLDAYGTSILPVMFSCLEDRLRQGADPAEPLDQYDYAVTSYSLWQSGLNLMTKTQYALALDDLRQSIIRYELAGMEPDVLWSWFDAIVCHLFLGQVPEANALYKKYFTRAISTSPHFETAAREMFTAFEVGDLDAIHNARDLIVHRWKGFGNSQYPLIFQNFEAYVMNRSTVVASPTIRETDVIAKYRMLLARPARPEDLETLVEIAKEVDLGNTKPDPETILRQIDISERTLANAISWDQGMLFLTTELHDDKDQIRLVGNCKLQMMVDACWIKVPRQRVGRTPARPRFRVEYDVLTYSSAKSNAIELSGNAVLREYWKKGIGKFQIQARLLFLLVHKIESVSCLSADLLTRSTRKIFPFYERVVRAMVGNLEYDDADMLRYTDVNFFESLLGPIAGQSPSQIPLHSLQLEILEALGLVREQTKAAEAVLQFYGFQQSNKYDLLDGGQYYETSILDFKRARFDRDLLARKAIRIDTSWPMLAICPCRRPTADFVALKCHANIEGHYLYLPEEIFTQLGTQKDEEFKVLLDTEISSLSHRS